MEEYSHETILGNRENIFGSEDSTIKGNLIFTYSINNKCSLEFTIVKPFIVRTIRSDGLSRSIVPSLFYKNAN